MVMMGSHWFHSPVSLTEILLLSAFPIFSLKHTSAYLCFPRPCMKALLAVKMVQSCSWESAVSASTQMCIYPTPHNGQRQPRVERHQWTGAFPWRRRVWGSLGTADLGGLPFPACRAEVDGAPGACEDTVTPALGCWWESTNMLPSHNSYTLLNSGKRFYF